MSKKTIHKISFKLAIQSFLCFFLSLLLVNQTFAAKPSEETLDFNNLNGIFYYDATGSNRGSGCFGSLGANMNYAGATVFSQAEMDKISQYQPFYEAAADQYNFPWQILAVLHSIESSLSNKNPGANPSTGLGEGIFQLHSYAADNQDIFQPNKQLTDDELQAQINMAAELISTNYGAGLDLFTPEGVKKMFFKYNGTARVYIEKALAMGFSEEEANNGEGSPYVMNRYDARRDPTVKSQMDPKWPGMYGHSGYIEDYEWTGFGAYVKFEALGGDVGSVACGGLVSGGMTAEEAYLFVKAYVDDPNECDEWSSICHIFKNGVGERGANCVTYVQYFLNKYTTLGIISPMGNGGDVVSNLINNHGLIDGGNIPRVYAVFSTRSPQYASAICDEDAGTRCGHTGVVLGINEEADEIYIGQMAYGAKRDWGLSRIVKKLSDYSNGDFTYAYTDEFLKGNL